MSAPRPPRQPSWRRRLPPRPALSLRARVSVQSAQGFLEFVLIMLLVFVVVISVLALTADTWAELFARLSGRAG